MQPRKLAAGQTLIRAREEVSGLFVLVDGELEVRRDSEDGPIVLGHLRPPALIGEISFVDGGPATATLLATCTCVLMHLDRAVLPTLMQDEPDLAGRLLQRISETMAERLDETGRAVAEQLGQGPERPRGIRRIRRLIAGLMGVR